MMLTINYYQVLAQEDMSDNVMVKKTHTLPSYKRRTYQFHQLSDNLT